MNATQRREALAWARAFGLTALVIVTAGALVLVGLSTIGGQ